MSIDTIQRTCEHTTQYKLLPTGTMLKKAFRSLHYACDIIYSDVPAIFDGSTAAVILFGTYSKVTDVHGIKRDN
jgi:hypothetical protein